MTRIASSWVDDVDRGPDWLIIRLRVPADEPPPTADEPRLAEAVWEILERHFTYRVVLELDALPLLWSYLAGQLVMLQKRIHQRGGLLRICGLSPANLRVLRSLRLETQLPHYRDRFAAMLFTPPRVPR